MDEQVTAPELPIENGAQETVETVPGILELPQESMETIETTEVPVDYGIALAQLQTTADCILAAIIILCGAVVGSALSFFLRDLWRA